MPLTFIDPNLNSFFLPPRVLSRSCLLSRVPIVTPTPVDDSPSWVKGGSPGVLRFLSRRFPTAVRMLTGV